MVSLTARACRKAQQLAKIDGNRGLSLRLYLEGKGCDGFYYGVSFDRRSADDICFDNEGLELIVDRATLKFVDDSTIDWIDDQRGQGFLVDNPNHRRYRGKFFKKTSWQQWLAEHQCPPAP